MSEIVSGDEMVIVRPGEDIVASMADNLREELKKAVGSGTANLVLDLTDVEMIDSVGLGVLIATYNSLHKAGGRVSIAHASRDILDLFGNMRLDRYFSIVGE